MKYSNFIIGLLVVLLLIGGVQAAPFSAWSAYGDSWYASNGTYAIVMWNTTGSHSWISTGNATDVEYLVVAGGGGASASPYGAGGLGGAGGYRVSSIFNTSGTISVVVGAGGTSSAVTNGTNGQNSSFSTIVSTYGGAGGLGASSVTTNGVNGVAGGSGGGGGGAATGHTPGNGGAGNLGGYSPVSGYAGSIGSAGAPAGGGGSSSVGLNGYGGSGTYNSINGTPILYAMGGGNTTQSIANSGNGGCNTTNNGNAGIVIIKYALPLTDPNPTSMIKYKRDNSGVQINNATPYVGTVFIRNVTSNITSINGNFTWDTRWFSVDNLRVNASTITGTTLASSYIGNGYATFNVSKPSGMVLPANATLDFNITYTNYTAPGTLDNFSFSTTSKYYDIGNSSFFNFKWIAGADAIVGTWGNPIINFAANATSPAIYIPVQFTDTSGNYPSAWDWNFGDGSTSTQQNPIHAYTSTGLKDVTLHAYMYQNASITNTSTKTGYINVTFTPPPAPVAFFTASPNPALVGGVVQFNDTSINSPTSWSWNFGDSSGSSLQNPQHVYGSAGNYTVSLTATSSYGSNTLSVTNYMRVAPAFAPVASFTINNTPNGVVPQTFLFTDTSTNIPASWLWTFQNDADPSHIDISVSQNPVYTFNAFGNWTIALQATNVAGSNTTSQILHLASFHGFNRRDLIMSPEFTLTVNIVDSVTNLPIPATVTDSLGNNQSTTMGIFVGTYPYSTVTLYIRSEGYDTQGVSYVVDSNMVRTVQMVKSPTITQTTTTWYVPKTIEFQVIDYAGNQIVGATINATFNSSSTLAGGNGDLVTWYGMNPAAANIAANGTLTMTGLSDSQGGIVFTMLSTLSYDVLVTYQSTTNYFNIHPQDSPYQLRFLVAVGPDTSLATCVYANGNTHTGLAAPDPYNMTMMWSYQDTCGLTSAIDYVVNDPDNSSFVVYNYHLTPVTSGIYVNNLTVSNTRGKSYVWYENATRTV